MQGICALKNIVASINQLQDHDNQSRKTPPSVAIPCSPFPKQVSDMVFVQGDQFIKQHAEPLWARDFFSVKSWALQGLVDMFLLVFIHVISRRVWVSPPTEHPTGA